MKVKLLKTHTRPIAMYGVESFHQNETSTLKFNAKKKDECNEDLILAA